MNSIESIWRKAILPVNATIQQAINNLDKVAIKIILVVNDVDELVGTISDGDIRPGLLKGLNLSRPNANVIHRNPLVVPAEMGRDTVIQLMLVNKIQQVPAVDGQGHIVGLHLWDEITAASPRQNMMVIMAGGMGTRLHPHTGNCPKPLLPVAGRPMLEHIIERAQLEGFRHFVLAIHYLGHMIEEHFGNGDRFGVRIDYLREQSPLGTAGALELFDSRPEIPFVVTNGDVITDIRYGEMLDFHVRSNAAATMAVRAYEWQNPFGVVRMDGVEIVGFEEKPLFQTHINAGVYILEPEALSLLESGKSCDMPTLFERLQARARRTVAYPMHEPWLDVGRPEDLKRANLENS